MRDEHVAQVRDLLARAGIDDAGRRTSAATARRAQLYTFKIDNAGAY